MSDNFEIKDDDLKQVVGGAGPSLSDETYAIWDALNKYEKILSGADLEVLEQIDTLFTCVCNDTDMIDSVYNAVEKFIPLLKNEQAKSEFSAICASAIAKANQWH